MQMLTTVFAMRFLCRTGTRLHLKSSKRRDKAKAPVRWKEALNTFLHGAAQGLGHEKGICVGCLEPSS